jgi:hypothetical protein
MSDAEKIRLLVTYRDAVSRLSAAGSPFDQGHYARVTELIVEALLGREATEQELDDVL